MSEAIEREQALAELGGERNADCNPETGTLPQRQRERTAASKQTHTKIETDVKVAESRIIDLESRRSMLLDQVHDLLRQKRKVDKRHYELEESISGRNVTDEDQKARYKEEERKQRIKNEETLRNHSERFKQLDKALKDEETLSKKYLEEKQKIEQEHTDLDEKLKERTDKMEFNRDEIIKARVKHSQLIKQQEMLDQEEKDLEKKNAELLRNNEDLEKENDGLKKQIALTVQRIDINNLLKSVDKEELHVLAHGNVQMNDMLSNLVYKWNFIKDRGLNDA